MGICASCLGLDRHPSQAEIDENDPLLDDEQPQYGGLENSGHLDEEELRREREIMEQITAEAADNMIDVSHPNSVEFGSRFAPSNHDTPEDNPATEQEAVQSDDNDNDNDNDEAAWLESLKAEGIDATGSVKGLEAPLVMDATDLRKPADPQHTPQRKQLRSVAG